MHLLQNGNDASHIHPHEEEDNDDDCESFWNLPLQMEAAEHKRVKFKDDEAKLMDNSSMNLE